MHWFLVGKGLMQTRGFLSKNLEKYFEKLPHVPIQSK